VFVAERTAGDTGSSDERFDADCDAKQGDTQPECPLAVDLLPSLAEARTLGDAAGNRGPQSEQDLQQLFATTAPESLVSQTDPCLQQQLTAAASEPSISTVNLSYSSQLIGMAMTLTELEAQVGHFSIFELITVLILLLTEVLINKEYENIHRERQHVIFPRKSPNAEELKIDYA
jgi:hypothetical protein